MGSCHFLQFSPQSNCGNMNPLSQREALASWAAYLAERRPMLLLGALLGQASQVLAIPPGTRLVDRQTRNS